jgi:hyperosmotically inducible protein
MLRMRRASPLRRFRLAALVVFCTIPTLLAARQSAPASGDAQLQATVEQKIAGLKLRPPITITVHDHVVMVDGTVPTLRVKLQIIDLARKTAGVSRVDSTLEIARPESDTTLAAAVSKAIQTYSRLGLYDYIDGSVRNGVVTLSGSVTDQQKRDELTDRIEDIRGVRDVAAKITVLPLSPLDDRIRAAIGNRIYSDPDFINYSRAAPPIHIIVENGHVTLVGIVSSNLERQKAEIAARQVSGVYSVDNKIQLSSQVQGAGR